jgi:hypothetical protein
MRAQKRQVAFVNYKDYIGMDITSLVTLPVWIMEPYTILQKVAEIMEYTQLLDRAAATEDPHERCAASCACSLDSENLASWGCCGVMPSWLNGLTFFQHSHRRYEILVFAAALSRPCQCSCDKLIPIHLL